MRTYTMEDIHMLIEDTMRMDISIPPPTPRNMRDFEIGSYRKHACDSLEEYIGKSFSGYLEYGADYIKKVVAQYRKDAEFCLEHAGSNRIIFEEQVEAAWTLLQVL